MIHTEFDFCHVDQALLDGQMLVVDSVDELSFGIMRLREHLEYITTARMWVNLYLTGANESVFDLHVDTHDTIILQLVGCRNWEVGAYAETLSQVDSGFSAPRQDYRMDPGSSLLMAGNTAHNVTGLGDVSLHLTLGFDRLAAIPYLLSPNADLLGLPVPSLKPAELQRAKAMITERRRGTCLPFLSSKKPEDAQLARWSSRLPPTIIGRAGSAVEVLSMGQQFTVERKFLPVLDMLVRGAEIDMRLAAEQIDGDVASLTEWTHSLALQGMVLCRASSEGQSSMP